ncbi:MAG: hypothetical protein MUF53_10270, partial [Gemmatimonadaceae bacterium]|nr:hypothetical protein [Gemmatimonadaceae bacterium]
MAAKKVAKKKGAKSATTPTPGATTKAAPKRATAKTTATRSTTAKRVAPAAVAEGGVTKRRYRPAAPSPAARKRTPAVPVVPEDEGPSAGSTLVVVESPAKAKTIGKYLGRGYRVR